MKENEMDRSGNEQRNTEQDPLRNPTTNEVIREVGEGRGENETLRDAELGSGRSYDYGTQGSEETENTSGTSVGGNQSTSRETMHGTADMKDEMVPGRGREMRRESGSGSGLTPKMGATGSDFDGQNSI